MKKTKGGQSISHKVQITVGFFERFLPPKDFLWEREVKQWCISKFESVLVQIFNYPLPCTHTQRLSQIRQASVDSQGLVQGLVLVGASCGLSLLRVELYLHTIPWHSRKVKIWGSQVIVGITLNLLMCLYMNVFQNKWFKFSVLHLRTWQRCVVTLWQTAVFRVTTLRNVSDE